MLGEQICSNGKHITGGVDGSVLIDTDSIPKAITRYRFSGWLSGLEEQTLVCSPESLPGFPDGMRVAADGGSAVVAFYNPQSSPYGQAHQIRLADGEGLTEWQLPGSPRVTCPEILMLDGRVQVIFTTAVEGMTADERRHCPNAGSLFIADTPYTEAPPPPPLVDVSGITGSLKAVAF
ncbi:MAG: SMP-30/gluconolactonase/LRE family protein [Acidobacteria bacterium]|nr:SMP-30/gluconolactonase/LRE family protein [Acidobacteriota bacterium]